MWAGRHDSFDLGYGASAAPLPSKSNRVAPIWQIPNPRRRTFSPRSAERRPRGPLQRGNRLLRHRRRSRLSRSPRRPPLRRNQRLLLLLRRPRRETSRNRPPTSWRPFETRGRAELRLRPQLLPPPQGTSRRARLTSSPPPGPGLLPSPPETNRLEPRISLRRSVAVVPASRPQPRPPLGLRRPSQRLPRQHPLPATGLPSRRC